MAFGMQGVGDVSQYELFDVFMRGARENVTAKASADSLDKKRCYAHITRTCVSHLRGDFSGAFKEEEKLQRVKVVDAAVFLQEVYRGNSPDGSVKKSLKICEDWLTSLGSPKEAGLLEDFEIIKNTLGIGVDPQPQDIDEELFKLWNAAREEVEERAFTIQDLHQLKEEYERGDRTWGIFAATVLEVHKLFESMHPDGVVPVEYLDEGVREMVSELPALARVLQNQLPENYLPVDIKDWQLPGSKRVTNLRQIWANPSLKSLPKMILKTAALCLRFFRGTYASWKLGRLARKMVAADDEGEAWKLLSQGYDLQWHRGRTSPEDFCTWLSDLTSVFGHGERQFPRLEAALATSGIFFPKKGEHFNPADFNSFLLEDDLHPGVRDMFNIRKDITDKAASVNRLMQEIAQFFEASRGFRGVPDLEKFEYLVDDLLGICINFENSFEEQLEYLDIDEDF